MTKKAFDQQYTSLTGHYNGYLESDSQAALTAARRIIRFLRGMSTASWTQLSSSSPPWNRKLSGVTLVDRILTAMCHLFESRNLKPTHVVSSQTFGRSLSNCC
jgi:hypothetical protein